MSGNTPVVFVCSTSRDLQPYRAVARNEILDMGWGLQMMEHFGALPESTVDACRRRMAQADLVLLIVGFRRGWVPSLEQGGDGTKSMTALELEEARARQIPVLVLLASEFWPQNLCEEGAEARAWVDAFRRNLGQPAEIFDYEDPIADESRRLPGFRTKVKKVLVDHRVRTIQVKPAPAESAAFAYRKEGIASALREGACIPFVGPSVYGTGPLSMPVLSRMMWPEAPPGEACHATTAEFLERKSLSREQFLSKFARMLSAQADVASPPATYELIARLVPAPPLVVSACHDMMLEDYLSETRRVAVVSHIVRSEGGTYDGRILVSVPGERAIICRADTLDTTGYDLVVYKPLGSPFLQAKADLGGPPPRWPGPEGGKWIDTVVATESDHLTFLGRLDNQHTKVPSVFHRPFQRMTVLFMGVPLDVWHNRLVLTVLRSVELKSGSAKSLAIRTPESAMEELTWEHLNTTVLQMDPNEFCQEAA